MMQENGLVRRSPAIIVPMRLAGLSAHRGRFTRFGFVGLSGALINIALLYLLVDVGHLQHLLAAALATEAAIISNFAFNDHWTFRDARAHSPWLTRLTRYNAVALGGLGISLLVLTVLTDHFGLHYLLAEMVAIVAATLWNYVVNARVTWRLSATTSAAQEASPLMLEPELYLVDTSAIGDH